jgi:hypothetical protein
MTKRKPPGKKDTAALVDKFTTALRGSGAIDVPALQRGLLEMIGHERGIAEMLYDGYEGAEDEPHVRVKYVDMILNVLIPKGQETGENLSTADDKDLEAVVTHAVGATVTEDDDDPAATEWPEVEDIQEEFEPPAGGESV